MHGRDLQARGLAPRIGVVLLAAGIGIALAAGAPAQRAAAAHHPPVATAIVAMEQEPICLNPVADACAAAWTHWITTLVLPGAFRQAPDFSFEPMLVKRADVATEPRFALTYHLKPQAEWSNGVPVGEGPGDHADPEPTLVGRPGAVARDRRLQADLRLQQ